MNTVIITFEDNTKREYRSGIKLAEIVKEMCPEKDIICANFNNNILNAGDAITKSGKLILYGMDSSIGSRVYERGLNFLFRTCALEILGKDTSIKIRNSIGKGVFFVIDKKVTDKDE